LTHEYASVTYGGGEENMSSLQLKKKKSLNTHFLAKAVVILILISWGTGCKFKSKSEPANTLHLVVEEKIKGLDPILAEDAYSSLQVLQIYDTLLQYNYLKRPYSLMPGLAESMPDVSADGLTYTFRLKKGVLFQDDPCFKATNGKGRELVAEDVVYSLKRLADPRLMSNGWWILDGKVEGLNAWREVSSKATETNYSQLVEGLKATDRYTVQMKLVKKSYQLPYLLAMQFASIVPHEAVEAYGKEFISHPVGTGAFQLAEYNPNSKIVLVKNPTYRKELYPSEGAPGDKEAGLLEDAGKPLPLADRVVVQVFVERQPMWLNFMSGLLDIVAIPKDNFATTITPTKELSPDLKSKGIRLIKSSGLDVTYATFNMSDPILGKNKYLRQALSLAYDEKTFIELFYNGRAIPAQGPVPPGFPSYDPDFKNPYRQFNLAKAKALLEKAGYPGGKGLPPIEYATTADTLGRQAAEYFQKIMGAIGVSVKVNNYSWPQLMETIRNRRAQMWEHAWLADYPDPENFFQLFYSKNVSPGPNDASYSNPEFDKLYEKSLTLPDGKERNEIYKKMRDIVVEDCPWIFKSHRLGYTVAQSWLKNYKPNDFDHTRYRYYRVDANLKK
jgi:ABC-type transport system substrate-binding protein